MGPLAKAASSVLSRRVLRHSRSRTTWPERVPVQLNRKIALDNWSVGFSSREPAAVSPDNALSGSLSGRRLPKLRSLIRQPGVRDGVDQPLRLDLLVEALLVKEDIDNFDGCA